MIRCLRLLVLLGLAVYCEAQRSACTTPDNKRGTCINIKQCPTLLEMLTKQRNDPNIRNFLTRSTCGYEGRTPKVCCPPQTQPPASSDPINPPNCGVSIEDEQDKIVGGHPAKRGAHPWITALGYRSWQDPTPRWRCGGAIVNRRYVVTAAHCLHHPTLTLFLVRIGEHNLDDRVSDGANPVDIEIAKAIEHPNYDADKKFNDIALLQLKQQITYDSYIKPVCLPTSPELRRNDFSVNSPTAAGWGKLEFKGSGTTQLMQVTIPVVENRICKANYAKKRGVIIDSQLCAGEGGKDTCQGDSGGPLVLPRNGNKYYLIGVVSYGFECATEGYPGIYTRVTSYVDWIQNTVK